MSTRFSSFSCCSLGSAIALAIVLSQAVAMPGRTDIAESHQPVVDAAAAADTATAADTASVDRAVWSDFGRRTQSIQLPVELSTFETDTSFETDASLLGVKSLDSFPQSQDMAPPQATTQSLDVAAKRFGEANDEGLQQDEIPIFAIESSGADSQNQDIGMPDLAKATAPNLTELSFSGLSDSGLFDSGLSDRAMASRGQGSAIATHANDLDPAPGDIPTIESVALAYIERGEYDRSVRLLEQFAATAPQNLDLQANLAWAYGWQGKLDRGIALYETILQQDPGHLKAQLGLAEFRSWQGKQREAIYLYRKIVAQYPDNLEARFKQAQLISWRGQYRQAIELYDGILEQHPNHRTIQLERAQVLNWAGKQKRAIAIYDDILSQEPDHLQAQLGRAQALSWAGKRNDALAVYTSILEQHPNHLEAQLGRAEAWTRSNRFRKGLALYESILQQHPDSIDALQGRAQTTHRLGHAKRAIALYQDALEQTPTAPELRLGLARVYYSQQRIRQALNVLQPLLDSKNPDALALRKKIQAVPVNIELRNNVHDNRSDVLIQQTARYRINDSDIVQSVTTGLQLFEQDNFQSLNNAPVQVGLEGQVGRVSLKGTVGSDRFDRIAAAPNLGFEVSSEILPNIFLSGIAEYGSHKFNVETLENGIAATRIGPELSWQIDRDTDLFASLRWGNYNDGNQELESLIYLERRFEGFFVAGSVYTLSFATDPENGYFAPSNYLFYGGEVGWEGNLADSLRCRLSVGLGGQQLEGDPSSANNYQVRCITTFSQNLEAGFGYRYSNLIDQTSAGDDSMNQTWFGHLRFTF